MSAAPESLPEKGLLLAVFNATAEDMDEPVDIDIPLPVDWPGRFQEFFGYEEKFSFTLTGPDGERDVPENPLHMSLRIRLGIVREPDIPEFDLSLRLGRLGRLVRVPGHRLVIQQAEHPFSTGH